MRKARRFALFAALITTATVAITACSQRNPDINRVEVTPYWTKSDFNPKDSWYYSTTVIESAPNAGYWGGPGEGDFLTLERLRWEVTETALIGWRDWEAAEGTEQESLDGGDDVFKGQPVAQFAITEHFDIQRTYDALTGEEGNEIVENTEDRPWYQREHFRVDWNVNMVPSYNWRIFVNQIAESWVVQQNDPGDPKRWRFDMDDDYFEITTRSAYVPDLNAVFGYYGAAHFLDLNPVVIDVRHSFRKVDPDNDFQSVDMPSSVILVDEDGNEVRDDEGYAVRVPVFDRHGYFTTWGRKSWDAERGFTQAGLNEKAIIFNVWEKSTKADGSIIPIEDRTPMPVEWYTNVVHPKKLMNGAQRVNDAWDEVYRDMVFYAQPGKYDSVDDVPAMFVLHENSCNVDNVKKHLDKLPADRHELVRALAYKPGFDGTIESVEDRFDNANDPDNDNSFTARQNEETQALRDLERICSALEHVTSPDVIGDTEEEITRFTYQRVGDLRYHMINAIVEKTTAAWIGVAGILGDPLTGEHIKATANLGVSALDRWSFSANQAISALNAEIALEDLFWSTDVKAYMRDKLRESQLLTSQKPGTQLKQRMDDKFAAMSAAGPGSALREISPAYGKSRLNEVAGTHIEDILMEDEDFFMYGRIDSNKLKQFNGDVDAALIDRVSPLRNRDELGIEAIRATWDRMGELGQDPIEFIDDMAISAAIKFRDMSERERYDAIREELYVSVQLHEVGHTVGLRHNFAASQDPMNFGREFWEIQQLPADMATAEAEVSGTMAQELQACQDELLQLRCQGEPLLDLVDFGDDCTDPRYGIDADFATQMTTQQCLGRTFKQHSTIMEYNGHWTSDFGGLGPYDRQAVKFGYAGLVEVFDDDAVTNDMTEDEIKRWMFLNDWRTLGEGGARPDGEPYDSVVNGIDRLYDRHYVKMEWDRFSTMTPPPVNAVPYKFCTDTYQTVDCQRHDVGPDMASVSAWSQYKYYQNYFFTHFNRDRFWDYWSGGWQGAASRDLGIMFDYTDKMQWYYMFKASDPEFTGSWREEDFLTATIQGLNFMNHVLGTPRSGTYINHRTSSVSGYTLDDPATQDRLAPSDIMRPFDNLGQCSALFMADIETVVDFSGLPTDRPVAASAGYALTKIPLGDGRPFALGSTSTETEDWIINYVGTYYSKQYALNLLGLPGAWFPRTDYFADPRTYYISWYKLFPEEIGRVVHNYVAENYADIGPVVNATTGEMHKRDLIDINTGESPDYDAMFGAGNTYRVIPTVAFNHQYFAALFSMAFMSEPYDGQYDMKNAYMIAVEGAEDDHGAFQAMEDGPDSDKLVEFTHPTSGRRMRAIDVGPNPVGARLLQRANVMKDRYETLNGCVEGTLDLATTEYCHCVQTVTERPDGFYCTAAFTEPPGEGLCAEYNLVFRRDSAREIMDDAVDFIDDVRFLRAALAR